MHFGGSGCADVSRNKSVTKQWYLYIFLCGPLAYENIKTKGERQRASQESQPKANICEK